MKSFLNDFMSENKRLGAYDKPTMCKVFQGTTNVVLEKLGTKAFKPRSTLNAAVQDSLMVGIARRLEAGPITADLTDEYESLMENKEFRELIYSQTSHLENVHRRVQLATEMFSDVE